MMRLFVFFVLMACSSGPAWGVDQHPRLSYEMYEPDSEHSKDHFTAQENLVLLQAYRQLFEEVGPCDNIFMFWEQLSATVMPTKTAVAINNHFNNFYRSKLLTLTDIDEEIVKLEKKVGNMKVERPFDSKLFLLRVATHLFPDLYYCCYYIILERNGQLLKNFDVQNLRRLALRRPLVFICFHS